MYLKLSLPRARPVVPNVDGDVSDAMAQLLPVDSVDGIESRALVSILPGSSALPYRTSRSRRFRHP